MASLVMRLLRTHVPVVGLEVGPTLRGVVLERSRPTAWGQREIPEGILLEGKVVDPEGLAAELRHLWREAGFRSRYVAVAVPNEIVFLRSISLPRSLPRLSNKEMEEAVKWEAERYIPFPLEEVVLDYHVPPGGEQGEMVPVWVGAIRLEDIMGYVEALRGAGLVPVVADAKANALLLPYEGRLGENPEEVRAFLDIGYHTSTLVLVRGNEVLGMRTFRPGGHPFSERLAEAFRVPLEEAERIKRTYGRVVPPDPEEFLLDFDLDTERYDPSRVYEILYPVALELAQEVRRSLAFFSAQGDLPPPGTLVLAGGGSRLLGMQSLLAEAVGVEVERYSPWGEVLPTTKKTRQSLLTLAEMAPEMGVAYGMALRGEEGP